jgi:hypothetical protein
MSSIPPDVFRYIFTKINMHLTVIINLSMVSHQWYQILLSEEYWLIISDTKRMLDKFIHQICHLEAVSYPVNKIQQMYQTDARNFWGNYTTLLDITCTDLNDFYKYFPNYQYLYVNGKYIDVESFNKNHLKVYA